MLGQRLGGGGAGGGIPGPEGNVGTGTREALGQAESDPPVASGDHGGLPGEVEGILGRLAHRRTPGLVV